MTKHDYRRDFEALGVIPRTFGPLYSRATTADFLASVTPQWTSPTEKRSRREIRENSGVWLLSRTVVAKKVSP